MDVQDRVRWVVAVLVMCVRVDVGAVTFENNGYHLLVAIDHNVTQDPRLISQLQDMFTSASDYLYTTTRNYTYIRLVTILVPGTWTKDPSWKEEDKITFTDADVRVDSPHPLKGNDPYTFQPGQCGEPGRYILLTPDYVLDKDNDRFINYGDAGRVLVHEFAHLRFGVFDEYGIPGSRQHPVYYVDDTGTTVRPTACSSDITGSFINKEEGLRCDPVDNTEVVNKDCGFFADDNNTATASVMYAQFLEKVVHFCESDPDNGRTDLVHNVNAPNRHNKMCNGRGTWDVIREHTDVKDNTPVEINDRAPQFNVVYSQREADGNTTICGRRIVLVFDLSGSMKVNFRYFKLRQIADRTIRGILPVGTEVGIVVFSDSARIWANMRVITSPTDRQMLAEGLPDLKDYGGATAIGKGLLEAIKNQPDRRILTAGLPDKAEYVGFTSIGSGLLDAIEMLNGTGKSAENGRIFLFTDGGENSSPLVVDILPDIVNSGVVVHTMAYSDSAAKVLRKLSTLTGGQYSFFGETSSSTALTAAADRLLKDLSLCDEYDDDIEIDRRAFVLTSTQDNFTRTLDIDSTVGNNTRFVFTLSHGAGTKITIEDPSGTVYDSDSSEYSKDETVNIIRFLFPLAETGTWKYILERNSTTDESITAVVTSRPRVDTLPFKVETWTSSKAYDYSGGGSGVVAYAYVHRGYAPIIRASVELEVFRPGDTFNITLHDNGLLPDNTANDGVYSNYLLGFKSNFRYSMGVRVESVEGETVIIISGNDQPGSTLSVFQNTTPPVRNETVEAFSRTASPDAIDISGYNPSVDQLDPGRVTDLDIAIESKLNETVTLSWTAPGDDLNVGEVEKYELRIAVTFASLRVNFTQASRVMNEDVVAGSMDPLPAGSQQLVTIRLPINWPSDFYVFGLKAFDEANRQSELSNLRSITLKPLTIPQPVPVPDEPAPGQPENSSTNFLIWVGVGLGAAVAVAVALVVIAICIYTRKPNPKENPT